MRRFLVCVCFVFCWRVAAFAASGSNDSEAALFDFDENLSAHLVFEDREFRVGQAIRCSVWIENAGKGQVDMWRTGPGNNFNFLVIGEDGKDLPKSSKGKERFPYGIGKGVFRAMSPFTVMPGERRRFEEMDLAQFFQIREPGVYVVAFVYVDGEFGPPRVICSSRAEVIVVTE